MQNVKREAAADHLPCVVRQGSRHECWGELAPFSDHSDVLVVYSVDVLVVSVAISKGNIV